MFIRNLRAWKEDKIDSREPVAQFLKSYSVLLTNHSFLIMSKFSNVNSRKS